MKAILLILISILFFFCSPKNSLEKKVKIGAEILISDSIKVIQNKNIALVCNHTSLLQNGTHLVDTLLNSGIKLKKIFSPEHGFKGTTEAGKLIDDENYVGPEIISLYGKKKKPDSLDLYNIDIVIFDIQDIGARFYTYISTLYKVIEACNELKIQLLILDRPNPLGGKNVAGPVVQKNYYSFISIAPISVIHGMTIGELALLFESEFISKKEKLVTSIIKMKNWNRELLWKDLNLNWNPPSPNIPDFNTAFIYPATCFIEGLNISEGRGTKNPFLLFGAPFLKSKIIKSEIQNNYSEFVSVTDTIFTPVSIPGKSTHPKYENQLCKGIKLKIKSFELDQIEFGIFLLETIYKYHKNELKFRENHFDLLFGSNRLRKELKEGKNKEYIIQLYDQELEYFKNIREVHLIY